MILFLEWLAKTYKFYLANALAFSSSLLLPLVSLTVNFRLIYKYFIRIGRSIGPRNKQLLWYLRRFRPWCCHWYLHRCQPLRWDILVDKNASTVSNNWEPTWKFYSGAHLNPAVTVALCLTGRSDWNQLPFHWMGQYLGAFLAAALVFGTYSDAINHYDPSHTVPGQVNTTTPTAGIFATYPHGPEISNGICL